MTESGRSQGRRKGRWVAWATWAYAGVVLAALALIRWRGDIWWPATVLLFAPRWPFLLPIAPLAAAAWWRRRRGLWASQAAIALVAAGPLMAASLPIGRLGASPPPGPRLRVMTFNRAGGAIDTDGLIRLVEREDIHLICFQEGEAARDPALEAYLTPARGWQMDRARMIASRLPIVAEWAPLDQWAGSYDFLLGQVFRVRVRPDSGPEFIVASAHLPTMRKGFEWLRAGDLAGFRREVDWRTGQVEALRGHLEAVSRWPVLVGGDLNTPADSPLLDPLRARFAFAFERAGWGYGYTRPAALPWTRIDHILVSPHWVVTRCWVGPDLGSDHLPLIAEVVLDPGRS